MKNTFTLFVEPGGAGNCTQAWEKVLSDGAPWIWNRADEHFYDSHRVVDWYYATGHLGHAAQSLYGEASSPVKPRWLNEHKN